MVAYLQGLRSHRSKGNGRIGLSQLLDLTQGNDDVLNDRLVAVLTPLVVLVVEFLHRSVW
jgi:hypothetical protein